jgi:hypothetical protein
MRLHILSVSVALGIRHAMRMRRILLSVTRHAPPWVFPHYLINGKIMENKILLTKFVF